MSYQLINNNIISGAYWYNQKIYGFVGIFSLICEIGSFVFLDFYDRILLKLNPTGRELILYRKN